ncbi:MAG: hypothetical protein ABSH41_27715 [Syntrophobacteraceae bacterium]|jgi:hypothetical protein
MKIDILRELFHAIQRCDWTEVITIAQAASEHPEKMQETPPPYSTLEERGRDFDLDQADFI